MNENIKERFDMFAKEYDRNRRKVIPDFDNFYHAGPDFLDFAGHAPQVLDIGAGTGLFSAVLLERYPKADLTLIDFSEEMLALAKQRFDGRANTRYVLDNYFVHEFDQTFDIIISALSIHHLNAGEKQALYKKIFSILNTCGEFINADEIISKYPAVQEKYEKNWLEFIVRNGASDEQLTQMRTNMALDDPSTVSDQLTWIAAAGFSQTDCLFKAGNFAVFYGKK